MVGHRDWDCGPWNAVWVCSTCRRMSPPDSRLDCSRMRRTSSIADSSADAAIGSVIVRLLQQVRGYQLWRSRLLPRLVAW